MKRGEESGGVKKRVIEGFAFAMKTLDEQGYLMILVMSFCTLNIFLDRMGCEAAISSCMYWRAPSPPTLP